MTRLLISVLAIALLPSGCDGDEPRSEPPDSPADSASAVEPAEGDDVLRSDPWPDDVDRIVSMAPNVTEILFELGLGDRVVAVTRYCDWPEEVEHLPSIGGGLNPDYEAILGAEPDVVVGVRDGPERELIDNIDRAGIAHGFIAVDGVDSVLRAIELLGHWFDVESRAEASVEQFETDLKAVSRRDAARIGEPMKSALLVFDRDPVVAAGPGSFGDELLEFAGIENALSSGANPYPVLDSEKIIDLDPDIIVDTTIDPGGESKDRYWGRFESLRAVEQDRVVHIDDPVMLRPGPRIPQAVEHLADTIEEL